MHSLTPWEAIPPFFAGFSLGIGLTLSALFLYVRTYGEPVEDGREDFSDCELPSPTRGR